MRQYTLPVTAMLLSVVALLVVVILLPTPLDDATMGMIRDSESRADDEVWIIHVPPTGCPEGWVKYPHIFELAGEKEHGCIQGQFANGNSVKTDYLRAKESLTLRIELELPEPRPKEVL